MVVGPSEFLFQMGNAGRDGKHCITLSFGEGSVFGFPDASTFSLPLNRVHRSMVCFKENSHPLQWKVPRQREIWMDCEGI